MNIQEIRQKFPQYKDLNDIQLASALHKKYYADMPFPEFSEKVGLTALEEAKAREQYSPTAGMSTTDKLLAGAGKAFTDISRGAAQIAGFGPSRADTDETKRLDAPLMDTKAGVVGNIGGNIAAAIPAAFIPGANTAVGASLVGAGLGALQPVGADDSRFNNTMTSGALGLAGYGSGRLLGKSVAAASRKMGDIERRVAEKAATQAASETASARSAAGNAAQNAYRQLEHLRELKAARPLTADEALVVARLEKELAEKALEKLMPAAAQKETTAAAYREAIETEAARAAKLAAEKLSGKEVKTQVMARLKRYGPAAVGGMIGNMIFPGLGGSVGGAATGLVLRPAIRSMFNLAKNPAVQHGLLSPLANAGMLANPATPQMLGLLGPSIYAAQQ